VEKGERGSWHVERRRENSFQVGTSGEETELKISHQTLEECTKSGKNKQSMVLHRVPIRYGSRRGRNRGLLIKR